MKIFNANDITLFLRGYAGENLDLRHLLYDCLRGPLRFECRCLTEITSTDDFPNSKLRKQFTNRAEPWMMFKPDPLLSSQVERVSQWILDFLDYAGPDYNGAIRLDARKKMKLIQSIQEALQKTNQRLLTDEEYLAAFEKRIISRDEAQRHIVHVEPLKGRCHLFRILTQKGMEIAGHKADNCFGDSHMPDRSTPHKYRVNNPDRYQYYSVRDPDGNTLLSLAVDIKYGGIDAGGNGRGFPAPHVPDRFYHLKEQSEDIIRERLPQLERNRPYGTFTYKPDVIQDVTERLSMTTGLASDGPFLQPAPDG